ncbi:MAG: hypothetical protein NT169_15705 [Chloroflexi bacterium]|nr:hypothetical protein [Chloroflexota bacterium]
MPRYRIGALLGAALGLAYGLTSQAITPLMLPGIPLYQPPLGLVGNIALSVAWGALLGLLCAWPTSGIAGTLFSSVASVLAAMVRFVFDLRSVGQDVPRVIMAVVIIGLPMIVVTAPAMGALRWAVARQVAADTPIARRLIVPLLGCVLVAAAGAFAVGQPSARALLARTHTLIEAGLRVTDAASLPAALRSPRVGAFFEQARGGYTLEWTDRNLDGFIELRPANSYERHSAVIARFTSGWTLVCLYPTAEAEPNCGGY